MNKGEAQKRTDRIRAFRAELAEVERDGAITLAPEQRNRLVSYHDRLMQRLAGDFDVDTSGEQKQLSIGMRIVASLGAAAIAAAVFFFFFRFWGLLTTTQQVAVLVASPVLATMGIEIAARRERTLYFAAIVGLVAFACFVLDLSMLGRIFNITPSQNAFLVWSGFAFILAYTYGLRILQVAAILSLAGWLAATVGTWSGCYWLSFGERPENFIAAGLAISGLSFLPHLRHSDFPAFYRIFGLLAVFIAVLILANYGLISYLPHSREIIEYLYQVVGFVGSGLTIWIGIRQRWPGTTNLGSTFFAIFLYTKFFDWWWDWLPKYLFFLLLGLVALLLLLILKRLRGGLTREVTP
jgi:uncharacterized membrane protein